MTKHIYCIYNDITHLSHLSLYNIASLMELNNEMRFRLYSIVQMIKMIVILLWYTFPSEMSFELLMLHCVLKFY